ncbi:MAG: long-chain-fatty-acid--CoA ligase [Deferribacterota bacterium]|nr:long-chain-fatty-acid--CoA ligase [Deferribacterota bacterium]
MLETSFGNLIDKAFRKYKDKTAFTINGRNYLYSEVHSTVNKLANGLSSLGLQKGDRVVVMCVNCIEWIYADIATAKIGLIKIPINKMQVKEDIEYRLKDSGARAVILDDYFYNKCGLFFQDYESIEFIVAITEDKEFLSQPVIDFYKLISESPSQTPEGLVNQEDLIAIMYTGGTTGAPKGVMHTHKSYVSIIYSQILEMEIFEGEVMLQTAPLPHSAGFLVPSCLLRGGRVLIMDGFDPEKVFQAIEKEKVTETFMVPTMIYTFLDHPARKNYDLSSLRTIVYGAAPISPRRLEEAIEELGPIFLQAYSQMEVANQTTVLSKSQHIEAIQQNKKKRLSSCGMPILMSQVKVVDDNGNEVGIDTPGEIITRGPHMMKGYWRQPEETKKTIINGWLYTGDMAKIDEDGFIYLVDRKKDMIISGGMNVYSAEVEHVLSQHPAVKEVIVIGIPDEKWGEAVCAVVVKAPDKEITEEDLIQFCRQRLSAYKRPKKIEFVEQIPRTPVGKYDKKLVRQKYWEGKERNI